MAISGPVVVIDSPKMATAKRLQIAGRFIEQAVQSLRVAEAHLRVIRSVDAVELLAEVEAARLLVQAVCEGRGKW